MRNKPRNEVNSQRDFDRANSEHKHRNDGPAMQNSTSARTSHAEQSVCRTRSSFFRRRVDSILADYSHAEGENANLPPGIVANTSLPPRLARQSSQFFTQLPTCPLPSNPRHRDATATALAGRSRLPDRSTPTPFVKTPLIPELRPRGTSSDAQSTGAGRAGFFRTPGQSASHSHGW